jgi:aspartyl-tRNA(Asn)/glutamyl-tRNA(Gln) amidotransferase subunit A
VRIGVIKELEQSDLLDPEVRAALAAAADLLRGLGAGVQEVSVPLALMAGPIFVGIGDTEAASVWDEALRTRPQELDSATRTRLQAAALLPASLYQRALKARRLLREQMLAALGEVDVLLSATACFQPPKQGQDAAIFSSSEDVRRRMHGRRSYVTGYPLAALPAISVPCGFTSSNLPVGMQLGGRPFDEETLLRVAYAYEQATPWHTRRPPIAEE